MSEQAEGVNGNRLVRTASSDPPPEDPTERRWRRRPVLAGVIRGVIVVAPLAASIAAGIAASRMFHPTTPLQLFGWLAWVGVVSIAVLAGVDVLARRLLPLQRLLQLCLVFPDRAPSRLRLAVRAARPRRPEALLSAHAVPTSAAAAATHVVQLLAALSVHDRRTRGHSERVCAYTELLAAQMNLSQDDRDRLMWVSLVHDVGKLEVPRRLLNKPGRPTVNEWHTLQAHPAHGDAIIAPMRPWFGEWADSVVQHHEQYDGSGYPQGLRGEQICLGARMIAVTDAFEVMTAPRPYRRPVDAQAARAELAREAGGHFDPVVVRHFLSIGLPELRRAMGLIAWLGQLPFIRDWPRLQSTGATATSQAATAVASTAGVLALGASAVVPATSSAASHASGGSGDHSVRQTLTHVHGDVTDDAASGMLAAPRQVRTASPQAPKGHRAHPAARPPHGGTAAPRHSPAHASTSKPAHPVAHPGRTHPSEPVTVTHRHGGATHESHSQPRTGSHPQHHPAPAPMRHRGWWQGRHRGWWLGRHRGWSHQEGRSHGRPQHTHRHDSGAAPHL